jgi:predicted membrane protein
VIDTLAITLLVEGLVVAIYAIVSRKPLVHLLISSVFANLFTQSILWLILNAFPRTYLLTLFIAEICIWAVEAAILHFYPFNRLKTREALFLSLVMNMASLSIGWFLPV